MITCLITAPKTNRVKWAWMETPKPGVQIILFFLRFLISGVLSQLQKPNETLPCSGETQRFQWKLLWLLCFLGERTSSSHDCLCDTPCVESSPISWLGSGISAQPSAALGSFGVCVSSILWELTFPYCFPGGNSSFCVPYVHLTLHANSHAISCQPEASVFTRPILAAFHLQSN